MHSTHEIDCKINIYNKGMVTMINIECILYGTRYTTTKFTFGGILGYRYEIQCI
jgi:hypothetical protein